MSPPTPAPPRFERFARKAVAVVAILVAVTLVTMFVVTWLAFGVSKLLEPVGVDSETVTWFALYLSPVLGFVLAAIQAVRVWRRPLPEERP